VADPKAIYVEGRDKNQLLRGLMSDSLGPGTQVFEQQRMGIFVRCTEDLESSIERYRKSNDKLSNRILWLNIILGIFTVVGTIIAIHEFLKKP
jgi:hypothetical protein